MSIALWNASIFKEPDGVVFDIREREKWDEKTRNLKPLEIGDNVYIQNLAGNNPLRWERTGVVVEAKPFHQYTVKVDGTGRVTLRNRRHLRKFTPYINQTQTKCIPLSYNKLPVEGPSITPQNPPYNAPQHSEEKNMEAPQKNLPISNRQTVPSHIPQRNDSPQFNIPENTTDESEHTIQESVIQPEEIPIHSAEPDLQKVAKKVPLTLRRLFPYNNPGKTE